MFVKFGNKLINTIYVSEIGWSSRTPSLAPQVWMKMATLEKQAEYQIKSMEFPSDDEAMAKFHELECLMTGRGANV